ncbi:putative spermidine/putrescine transport system ATP-binding protein [Kineococcus xinjiangensis]|uniref:Putative spermidine/putrescine transport system ATP-binding protein n=1 Tax=Kineococcus xinjiangensis TaxID=512762 RepID=A0A2S6IVQ9_9ACTN|nr:ABC transporter ATP-binding protein [Kineococcus xinjiangensis]PPK98154.1 putative spermidine/putrescine transport system ATP-binding protein [Kineococcus xinjiangensis]
MTAALAVRNLGRDHGGGQAPALDGLNLDVPAGSCLALVGPSGSGKTTALRLVAGLEVPDRGDVLLDGRSVVALPPERRGVSMVFQRPLLFPHLDVLDNVAFSARVAGASRRAARAAAAPFLDLVQMGGYTTRRPGQLSGGQEQRVALARALAARPRVLLLDEAFTGLDVALREDMHELLHQLRAVLEPTVVLVTHDHAEAAALADSVAVLSGGRLLQHGDAGRIYTRPASVTVSRLLGGRNEVPGVVVGGEHRSALGRLRLPTDVAVPDGPAVLLVRQEAVVVTGPDAPGADAAGTVLAVRAAGARRALTVEVVSPGGAAVQVHAETSPGQVFTRGERVGLRLPSSAVSAVPPEDAGTEEPEIADRRTADAGRMPRTHRVASPAVPDAGVRPDAPGAPRRRNHHGDHGT